jgi:aspartate kinase
LRTPVLKFGGLTLQGQQRYGPDEERLLEECRRQNSPNDIYRLLAQRRNIARAQRLHEVARKFILPMREAGMVPVVVVSAFDWATDKLEQLAAALSPNPAPREYARLLMSGELRANSSLAIVLEDLGCRARSMTGREAGLVTTPVPIGALMDSVNRAYLLDLIEMEIVPVVAGFQGYYYDKETGRDETSILGRGGSNLTAVALAAALGEEEATMFTDVDGVYDKDPRAFPDAVKLSQVRASELFTWEPFPQVIQKEAVEYAVQQGVNIWIRSGVQHDVPGTLIVCRE